MKLGSIALNSFLILLFLYIFVIIFLFFYQRKLLYHPSENNYLDQTSLNHNIEKKFIQSENKLVSWYFEKNSDYKTILFFHGNAGKLDNRVYKLNELSKLEINYLIIAYRGFSGNEGKPTESGLYQDAKSAKIWLNNNGVKDKDIILYGESLVTAVAVDLASKHKFAGIILESPFTSMTRLAQKVPFSMGVEIFDKSNTQKTKYFIKNDDHMMNFDQNLISEIQEFIKSLK